MWHSETDLKILKELNTSESGLSFKEATERYKKYGSNSIPRKKQDSIFKIFVSQFTSPIVIILIIAIFLSIIVKDMASAVFILIVVMINAILGTVQENHANRSAEKLQDMIEVKTKVKRDGEVTEINSYNLVVGDIVVLESGDKVPADIRLIQTNNLNIDESILTGESEQSIKNTEVLKEEVGLSDRTNMAYAGTIVLSGRGLGVVVETAVSTELGKIADKVLNTKDTPSPLIIRTNKFSKQLSIAFSIFTLVLAIVLYYKGYMLREIFFSVVSLTVSAIPEGLSTAITIALSISSGRMAKKNVIVKQLSAVESLGSCTVIASDKTGTLTVNEQTAKVIALPWGDKFDISGVGYNGDGEVQIDETKDEDNKKYVELLATLGVLNNEASLEFKNDKWISSGDSIDIAFLCLGKKMGINKDTIKDYKIVATIPYESKEKYSAVCYRECGGRNFFTVKGSTERILDFCDKVCTKQGNEKIDKSVILNQNEQLALNGYRVIALAYGEKENLVYKEHYSSKDIPKLTFIGLVGFIDPVRDDVVESVNMCKDAGIKVYMITGDHPSTAFSIAKKLNIVTDYSEVATGKDIESKMALGKESLDDYIKNIKVCARVTPIEKLEIVESLKRQGEFVAATGDGANDAPALKSANIGVAMGSGTDVTKETGDMIITDNNFSSIVTGVMEGRKAYNNIRNVVYLLLSTGFSEIILFILSVLFNMPVPLTSIQFLWLNLITNGIQGDALAFEKGSDNVMKEKVRNTKEGIFNRLLINEIFLSSFCMGIIAFMVYFYLYNIVNFRIDATRTYIMTIMVFMENIHILNCRSERVSAFKIPAKENWFVIISIILTSIVQIIIVTLPGIAYLFDLECLPLYTSVSLILFSVPLIIVMELFKKYNYKRLPN